MQKVIISVLIAITLTLFVALYNINHNQKSFGSIGNVNTQSCTVTETKVVVGHQLARTLLSANSRRAWAVIQQPIYATNTVQVDLGGTAVFGAGSYQLTSATTTSPVPSLTLGLSTDLPFTGAVTGITQSASSTVNVTECVY